MGSVVVVAVQPIGRHVTNFLQVVEHVAVEHLGAVGFVESFDIGHFGYDLSVTQDTCATCPPSPGTLSAMEMESLSAISGMRNHHPDRPRRVHG